MVWLISFLNVSNIAIGYGLAVYFHRQYGTAMPACPTLRGKKSPAPAAPPVAAEVLTVSRVVVNEMIEAEAVEAKESAPVDISRVPSPVPTEEIGLTAAAEEIGGLPPVDEENVLAGIEEFRSQLAKMNVAAEDEPAAETEELESELVGAAR